MNKTQAEQKIMILKEDFKKITRRYLNSVESTFKDNLNDLMNFIRQNELLKNKICDIITKANLQITKEEITNNAIQYKSLETKEEKIAFVYIYLEAIENKTKPAVIVSRQLKKFSRVKSHEDKLKIFNEQYVKKLIDELEKEINIHIKENYPLNTIINNFNNGDGDFFSQFGDNSTQNNTKINSKLKTEKFRELIKKSIEEFNSLEENNETNKIKDILISTWNNINEITKREAILNKNLEQMPNMKVLLEILKGEE